jgi:hypothetical protein
MDQCGVRLTLKQPLFLQVVVTDGAIVPQLGQLDRHEKLHILSGEGTIALALTFK